MEKRNKPKPKAKSSPQPSLKLTPTRREPPRSLLRILPRAEGARILVAGLEPGFARKLSNLLERAGYHPQLASRISEGVELLSQDNYHAVVVPLSDNYGHLVTEMIRGLGISRARLPIIVLFRRRHPYEGALCYALGASMVMVEPVEPIEVVAALGALLNLAPPTQLEINSEQQEGGEESEDRAQTHLVVEPERRQIIIDGRKVKLTQREFELFSYLLKASPRAVTRRELLSAVWGFDQSRNASRTVETHIARLRSKIEPNPKQPRYLITLYRQGYRLII